MEQLLQSPVRSHLTLPHIQEQDDEPKEPDCSLEIKEGVRSQTNIREPAAKMADCRVKTWLTRPVLSFLSTPAGVNIESLSSCTDWLISGAGQKGFSL